MRSPDADTASPPFAVGGGFLGEYFGEVLVGNEEVGHGNGVVVVVVVVVGIGGGRCGGGGGGGGCSVGVMIVFIVVIGNSLLSSGGGSGARLVRVGREWHEEINLTALEVGFRWDDDDLGEGGGVIGASGGG